MDKPVLVNIEDQSRPYSEIDYEKARRNLAEVRKGRDITPNLVPSVEELDDAMKEVRKSITIEDDGADLVPQTTIDPDSSPRARVLARAAGAVLKQRNANYGDPEDNFQTVAELWTAYWKRRILASPDEYEADPMPFSRADVAAMTGLIKVARLAQTPTHEDSWTDLAGYAACGLGCAEEDARERTFKDEILS